MQKNKTKHFTAQQNLASLTFLGTLGSLSRTQMRDFGVYRISKTNFKISGLHGFKIS